MTGNYRLADKLKREFRERGSEVNGMRATATSELMRRAEMGRDPRINCAEEAFHENYRSVRRPHPAANFQNPHSGNPPHNGRTMPSSVERRNSRTTAAHTASVGRNAAESVQNDRPQQRRSDAAGAPRHTEKTVRSPSGRTGKTVNLPQCRAAGTMAAAKEEGHPVQQVQKKVLPPLLFVYLIVATVLFLSFIFSITEVYKASSRLAQLQNQLEQLEAAEQDMELRLEKKNDLREIEAIATGKLGMTKEDSLQRRFVSLSDGERIELAETEEENTAGGVMLSSVFSALGRFLERFR